MSDLGPNVGAAHVTISPDLSTFGDKTRAGLDKERIEADVPVKPTIAKADTEKVKSELAKTFGGQDDIIRPVVNQKEVALLKADLARIFSSEDDKIRPQVDNADIVKARAILDEGLKDVKAKVGADTKDLDLKLLAEEAKRRDITMHVKADTSLFDQAAIKAAMTSERDFQRLFEEKAVADAAIGGDKAGQGFVANMRARVAGAKSSFDGLLLDEFGNAAKASGDKSADDWLTNLRTKVGADAGNATQKFFNRARADAGKAGSDSGKNFVAGFKAGAGGGGQGGYAAALLPGGGQGSATARSGLIGMALPLVPSAAAGLAYPLAGAASSLFPAAVGLAALLPVIKSDYADLTTATSALNKAQNTFDSNADTTSRVLGNQTFQTKTLTAAQQAQAIGLQAHIAALGQAALGTKTLTASQQASVTGLQARISALQATATSTRTLTAAQQAQVTSLQAHISAYQQMATTTKGLTTLQKAALASDQARLQALTSTTGTVKGLTAAQQASLIGDQARLQALTSQTGAVKGLTAAQQAQLISDQARLQALQAGTNVAAGFTDAQINLVNELSVQGTSWATLTTAQQNAALQIRNNSTEYKALTNSQQNSLNALIAQKSALDALDPSQRQAALGLMDLKSRFEQLKADTAPAVFQLFGDAMTVVSDIMKQLSPLVNQAASALDFLMQRMDLAVNSAGFKQFIQDMSVQTYSSIITWGKVLGDVALGFVRILQAIQPMAGPFNEILLSGAQYFRDWATSASGLQKITNFMSDSTKAATPFWEALKNLAQALGTIIADMASQRGFLWGLTTTTGALNELVKLFPSGVVQVIAMGVAFAKLAQALRLVAIAQGLMNLTGIGSSASAAGSAASKAALSATGAAGVIRGAGATSLIAGQAVGTTGLTVADSGTTAMIAGTVPSMASIAAIPLAAAAVVAGIGIYADQIRQASDKAAGVIENSSGQMTAATSVSGVHVSQAFRDMANNVAASSQTVNSNVLTAGEGVSNRLGVYRQNFTSQNDALKAVMDVGRTQFGQSTLLFIQQWHGDVASISDAVQKSDKTMDQVFSTSMQSAFTNWAQKFPQFWSGLSETNNAASKAAFDKVEATTKQDYTSLQAAFNQYEDDLRNGRIDQSKQDYQRFSQAWSQFQTDSVNGNINTANTQISRLSQDMAKMIADMTANNTAGAQTDIANMTKDLSGAYTSSADTMEGAAAAALKQSQAAYSQALQAEINQYYPASAAGAHLHNAGFASGGLVRGPGSGTSDSIPALLSNGEFVVNARSTSQHRSLLEAINAPRFANGGLAATVGGDVATMGTADIGNYLLGMQQLTQLGQAKLAAAAAASVGGSIPSGSQLAIINAALKAAGVPPPGALAQWQAGLNTLITRESGWNPNAINLTDSNAAAGDPSRGLAQTIMSTFMAYHAAGTSTNIYDPVANVAAAIRYIVATYGNISNVQQANANLPPKGYDSGGPWPSGILGINTSGMTEGVLTGKGVSNLGGMQNVHALNSGAKLGGGGTMVANIEIPVYLDSSVIEHIAYTLITDNETQTARLLSAGAGMAG